MYFRDVSGDSIIPFTPPAYYNVRPNRHLCQLEPLLRPYAFLQIEAWASIVIRQNA